ncbi:rhodanese-like domain-containing protein [Leucothrix mucor]|uniref:rhodanese-like domain-containing protein n=1 Tax=Leucothrix mucor TaxID=45248 RepID=UPI0003B34AC1|nr:rhodanese-like domain-containing protein [Leucothrix mucor]
MKNKKMLALVAFLAVMGSSAVYAESHAEMSEETATEVAVEAAEMVADVEADMAAEAATEATTDAADAEKSSVISDTSIAIYSQNAYIQSIMEKTTHIQATRLKEIMARGDEILLLDVRPRSEFESTPGIEGTAMNIPRNFLEVEAYEKLADKDAAIIIVSSKGIRGGLAANTLTAMGYTNVRNLLGGVEGWTK